MFHSRADRLTPIVQGMFRGVQSSYSTPVPIAALLDYANEPFSVIIATPEPLDEGTHWSVVGLTDHLVVKVTGTVTKDGKASSDASMTAWPVKDLLAVGVDHIEVTDDLGDVVTLASWTFCFAGNREIVLDTHNRTPDQRESIDRLGLSLMQQLASDTEAIRPPATGPLQA